MSSDDLFAAEEDGIASGEQLIADGSFGSVEDERRYQQLLKNYQKLFRTTRRLMRLSDHNELRINAAAEVIARKNKELEALSTKLSKCLSLEIYNLIFTGAQNVEIASSRKKLTIFFSDVVNFTETTDKLESEELTNLLNRHVTEMCGLRRSTAPPSINISVMPSWKTLWLAYGWASRCCAACASFAPSGRNWAPSTRFNFESALTPVTALPIFPTLTNFSVPALAIRQRASCEPTTLPNPGSEPRVGVNSCCEFALQVGQPKI
jgi:hypothetical protein